MKSYTVAIVRMSQLTLASLVAAAPTARADIFQWEYINPADPSEGKQPSTVLCPDGAGANAAQGTDLSYRNLTKAYLIGADLGAYDNGSQYYPSNLTGTNLNQADLTN